MRTVSTKLDNKLHEQFLDLCNNDGKCQSEFLREMIEDMFEGVDEENRHPTPQDPKESSTLTSTEGKIIGVISDSGEVKEILNPRISFD